MELWQGQADQRRSHRMDDTVLIGENEVAGPEGLKTPVLLVDQVVVIPTQQHEIVGLGFAEVGSVRAGKYIEMRLDAASRDEAAARVTDMCRRLLANPVIEDFRFEIEGG